MEELAGLGEQLRQCIAAMANPTRGLMIMELARAGELTPTQLASRVGSPATNIYHHIRVLRRLGLVGEPRVVARPSYVEKFYRLPPQLQAVLRQDPESIDRTQAGLTAEERQAFAASLVLAEIHLLHQVVRRIQSTDPAEFDRLAFKQELAMTSVSRLSRPAYQRYLAALRELVASESTRFARGEDEAMATDLIVITAMPSLWDRGD